MIELGAKGLPIVFCSSLSEHAVPAMQATNIK